MVLENANVGLCIVFQAVIYLTFQFQGVETNFQRGATSSFAYMELGKFEDCGVDSSPIDTSYATTRYHCGIKCLRQSGCLSYEYNDVNKTCNLHSTGALLNLIPKFGFVYVDGDQPRTVSK